MSGKSAMVREVVLREYVEPARRSNARISIRQGDLKAKMVKLGFPARNANQLGTSIEAEKFWRPLGLQLRSPKGQSRCADTIYEFDFVAGLTVPTQQPDAAVEGPDERAERFVSSLRGLLKKELAEYGGAEGFIRWIRSEDEAA